MRRLFKWIGIALLCPVVLFFILTGLLYLPPVQNWAVDKVAEIASEKTDMQISVGRVGLSFPLDLEVEDVKVVRDTDIVANIRQVIVDVQLLPLFEQQVIVDQLEIGQADINTIDFISDLQVKGHVGRLAVSSRGIDWGKGTVELNGTMLADADVTILLSDTAAVDTTTSETPWLIKVDSIVIARSRVEVHMPGDTMQIEASMQRASATEGVIDLLAGRYTVHSFEWRNGKLAYDQNYEPRQAGGIDYNHLYLTDIGLKVDSVFFCSPELMLRISEASLREQQSGLELTQLQGSIMMDSTTLRLPQLRLSTPYSNIRAQGNIDLNVADSVNPGEMDIDLDAAIGKKDLLVFLADQSTTLGSRWPEWPLNVKAKAKGNLERAQISQLDITLPTAFHAEARGTVGSVTDLNALMTDLSVQAETYDLGFLSAFVPDYGRTYQLPRGFVVRGSVKANGPVYATNLLLRDGRGSATIKGHLDQRGMSYDADVDISELNLNHFLPGTDLGLLSATASAKGKGTDFMQKSSWIEADAYVSQLQYSNVSADSIQATIRLNDGHAVATITGHNQLLDGSVSADALLETKSLRATIGTDLNRLNLYALDLVDQPISIGACGHIDINSDLNEQHYVSALFNDLYINDSLKTYRPQDVGLLLKTNSDTTLTRLQSGNLILKLDATGSLSHLANQLNILADSVSEQVNTRTIDQAQIKRLLPTMRLYVTSGNDNPIANFLRSSSNIDFSEVLVDLTTSAEKGINGTSHIHKLNADSTRIDTIRLNLVEKAHGMTFNGLMANNKKNPQMVFKMLFDGLLQEHGASMGVRFYDQDERLGLRIGAQAAMAENGINFHFIPKNPTIGYKEFTLNEDNFLFIQDNLRLRAKVDLIAEDGTGVKIYSEEQDSTLLQDLTVSLYRFDLGKLTEVIPYVPRITGELNGDYHLVMNGQKQISVATDMDVKQMTYENSPIGNVSTEFVYLQREDNTHAVEGRLLLEEKEVCRLRGEYRNEDNGYLNANMKMTHFPLELSNGFIPDQLIGFEGFAEGDMSVVGTMKNLDVDGEVLLDSAALISVPYGMRMGFEKKTVTIRDSRLMLDGFKMFAYNQEPLQITGNIDFHNTERITMDIRMLARNYQIINSKQTSKSIAYGKAFVNMYASMIGRLDRLRMRGRLDVLGTTDLNYILLDSPLSTDNQLEELVKFTDFNDSTETSVKKPTPDGLDVDLTLSIDQGAHVKCALNVDQSNYVDLYGGGDLRMKYTAEGISMTGRYTMSSGEMKYSLPIIPLKTFNIQEGSYVEFTGDPTNPRLNITATERTKAPVGQDGEQSRSVVFDCGIVVTKTLNDMGLEFIISAPEDNAISNELSAMTVEERGKIAVTMLTTGMYLADGNTSGFSMNSALSSFLQSEINNITGNALKTLDLSIGLDNTTDASGQMHTDYSFKFAKRFWNNRLKVQIGGKVSTGQEMTNGRNQSFFDNVAMEYRLSPTSNQYVKLFYNQNVYDWLDGYTSEYGGGYIWKRRLSSFWDIFKFWGTEKQRMPSRNMQGWRRPTNQTQTDSIKANVNENK